MLVSPPTAYELLHAFGQLEFQLKQIPSLTANQRGRAAVDWRAVKRAVSELPDARFLDTVSTQAREKLLAEPRDRPMIQFAYAVNGGHAAEFAVLPLDDCDTKALVEAMTRVRNNLFHGGKENPLEERYPGDDEEWAIAAHEVARALLELVPCLR